MNGRNSIYALAIIVGALDAHADPTIFRCEVDGKVTYSDKACAEGAEKTVITDTSPNSFSVDEPTHRSKTAAPKKIAHRTGSIAEEQLRHKERCKDLSEQLDAIANKLWMNDGGRKHAASQDKLHAKQHKLEQQRVAEKCH